MPLTQISLREGTSEAYRQAIFEGVYQAMRETFNVPEDDQFMTVTEYSAANFHYSRNYLGIKRSDNLVIIQITANNTRNVEQKKALYGDIARRLSENPGIRPEDIFISLVEVAKENWSFGNGIAQYA